MTRAQAINASIKKGFLRLRPPTLHMGLALHQLTAFGEWCRDQGVDGLPHFSERFAMYEFLSRDSGTIDYLEFGVFTGSSIKRWTELNRDPGSRFYGFDTFTGLPEAWVQSTHTLPAGYFDVGGKFPSIDDSRVRFIAGRFQDSLDPFLEHWKPENRLALHLDADLYSATLFVLATMRGYLKSGSIIVFDEFNSVNHEFRACLDFLSAFPVKMKPIAWAGPFYQQMALEVTSDQPIPSAAR